MANSDPAVLGLRKWKMAWRSVMVLTAFDVLNLGLLLVAAHNQWIAKGGVQALWSTLIMQFFAGVGAIVLLYIGGNAAVHFAKRNQNPGGG